MTVTSAATPRVPATAAMMMVLVLSTGKLLHVSYKPFMAFENVEQSLPASGKFVARIALMVSRTTPELAMQSAPAVRVELALKKLATASPTFSTERQFANEVSMLPPATVAST